MANRREQRAHFAVITERERIADALTRNVRRLTACCLRRNKWSGSRSLLRCQPGIRIQLADGCMADQRPMAARGCGGSGTRPTSSKSASRSGPTTRSGGTWVRSAVPDAFGAGGPLLNAQLYTREREMNTTVHLTLLKILEPSATGLCEPDLHVFAKLFEESGLCLSLWNEVCACEASRPRNRDGAANARSRFICVAFRRLTKSGSQADWA